MENLTEQSIKMLCGLRCLLIKIFALVCFGEQIMCVLDILIPLARCFPAASNAQGKFIEKLYLSSMVMK